MGIILYLDGEIIVCEEDCNGIKDWFWGVCGVGELEVGGVLIMLWGICFIWVLLFWEDYIFYVIFFDGFKGEVFVCEGFIVFFFFF